MKKGVAWAILTDSVHGWIEDKAPRLGAALAYYSVFSIAPLLIIVIAIAGLVFGEQAARGEIVGEIRDTVGPLAAAAIEDLLKHAGATGGSLLATVVGLAVLVLGATGVFVQLQDALNTIWKVAPKPGRGFGGMLRDRLLSFTVVLGTGFLLLVSLTVSAALAVLDRFMTPVELPGGAYLWQALNTAISFGLVTLMFAMIYKLLPDVQIAWRDVWVGAALTASLFTAGKYLIALYLGQGSTTSAFGAAGSLVVVLLWVYYSSQILLFGAEFTRAWTNHAGSPVVPTRNAVRVTAASPPQQGMPNAGDERTTASRASEKSNSQP